MEQSERLAPCATESESELESSSPAHTRTEGTEVKSVFGGELTVPKFYAGKNVFVTGATGFVGKVLIEKLLRCCPDLSHIYCLIRPKNNQDIHQRLNELTDSKVPVFLVCLSSVCLSLIFFLMLPAPPPPPVTKLGEGWIYILFFCGVN